MFIQIAYLPTFNTCLSFSHRSLIVGKLQPGMGVHWWIAGPSGCIPVLLLIPWGICLASFGKGGGGLCVSFAGGYVCVRDWVNGLDVCMRACVRACVFTSFGSRRNWNRISIRRWNCCMKEKEFACWKLWSDLRFSCSSKTWFTRLSTPARQGQRNKPAN